jgi:hypothetical protein
MSGGSMDYLSYKVQDASFLCNSPQRRAFAKHLKKVAAALHAIEWNDSGDGAPDELQLIEAVLHPGDTLEAAIEAATVASRELKALVELLK